MGKPRGCEPLNFCIGDKLKVIFSLVYQVLLEACLFLEGSEISDFMRSGSIFPLLNSIETVHIFHSYCADEALCVSNSYSDNNTHSLVEEERSEIYR